MKKLLPLLVLLAAGFCVPRAPGRIAPIIGQIPSPILGRYDDGVNPAQYVYPDAFNLLYLYYDDNITSASVKWTYEIIGTPHYLINGVPPINSAIDNPQNPPSNLDIFHTIAPAEINPDGQPNTITIRNQSLSPLGTSTTDNSETGLTDSQLVTFWVTDGVYATSSTVLFYTDLDGSNRLSDPSPWTRHAEDIFSGHAWPVAGNLEGNVTTHTWVDGKGVCLKVTNTGDNWGAVANPMGSITLTDNMVYRIRLKMNCSQLTTGKTPFWDFILENWDGDSAHGLNFYGTDTFFFDNEGGANAIVNKTIGTDVTMIWAPAAFQTKQWRNTATGIFAYNPPPPNGNGVDYHLVKDARLRFRVMDLDARADLQNNNKLGSICLQNVIVETCPFSRRIYEATGTATPPTKDQYGVTTLKSAHNNPNDPVKGNLMVSSLLGSNVYFDAGILTLTPVGPARDNEIVTITPATDLKYVPGNWPTLADDWPIPWESNKIYELKVELSAPTPNDEAHPFDVLWMNMEPPTNEVITESYITANHGIATPKYNKGIPQPYYMYYYSNKETHSAMAAYHFLRWRLRLGNSAHCNWPEVINQLNTGAVRVHSIRVNKVRFE